MHNLYIVHLNVLNTSHKFWYLYMFRDCVILLCKSIYAAGVWRVHVKLTVDYVLTKQIVYILIIIVKSEDIKYFMKYYVIVFRKTPFESRQNQHLLDLNHKKFT